MEVKEVIKRAYKIACDHGFHDKKLSVAHMLMLVITEVAEAVEADRKNKRANVAMFERESKTTQEPRHVTAHWKFCFEQFVKDTLEDELADVAIRLFDMCGAMGYTIEEIGGCEIDYMDTFAEYALYLTERIISIWLFEVLCTDPAKEIRLALEVLFGIARKYRIDLEWHIEQKMRYNELRPKLNGKKY